MPRKKPPNKAQRETVSRLTDFTPDEVAELAEREQRTLRRLAKKGKGAKRG